MSATAQILEFPVSRLSWSSQQFFEANDTRPKEGRCYNYFVTNFTHFKANFGKSLRREPALKRAQIRAAVTQRGGNTIVKVHVYGVAYQPNGDYLKRVVTEHMAKYQNAAKDAFRLEVILKA